MLKHKRIKRHISIRRNIFGTKNKPRLAVFRSNQHIYAQLINDAEGKTLISESDAKINSGSKKEKAKLVGQNLSKKALNLKIKKIVFDRGGFKFHGRIESLAKGAREGGLEF